MQNNEQNQKTRKGPRRFTQEEIQKIRDHWTAWNSEHAKKMKTDPEYRKHWEKRKEDFDRIALLNDSIETNI